MPRNVPSWINYLVVQRAPIRVWGPNGRGSEPRCEGRVVGCITSPVLIIQDEDGETHYESADHTLDIGIWYDAEHFKLTGAIDLKFMHPTQENGQ